VDHHRNDYEVFGLNLGLACIHRT